MVLKGLKFGMLLQLAIGPMCLMVFDTSATYGFKEGFCLMLAIALADAFYIALSCVGVAALIGRKCVKAAIKLVGGAVLVLFGINTIEGAFRISFLPDVQIFSNASGQNLFVQGLLLTASNPLTIIFWSSMFSTQMTENEWSKKQLFFFAEGCVLATVLFLTTVAFLGSLLSGFLPQIAIKILNVVVGAVLILFGLKLVWKKDKNETTAQ